MRSFFLFFYFSFTSFCFIYRFLRETSLVYGVTYTCTIQTSRMTHVGSPGRRSLLLVTHGLSRVEDNPSLMLTHVTTNPWSAPRLSLPTRDVNLSPLQFPSTRPGVSWLVHGPQRGTRCLRLSALEESLTSVYDDTRRSITQK